MLVVFIRRKIGILGGMGPEATADAYMSIVRIFQQRFNAKYDADFPAIIIYSMPAPDVVESMENEKLLVEMLAEGVKKLENAGADFIIIACNTVQYYLPQMRSAVSIPIIGLMEETAERVKRRGYRKVGVLGTGITIGKNLYGNACKSKGIETISPTEEQQETITRVIMEILSGNIEKPKQLLKKVISEMKQKGAEAVILGCTELPLAIKQRDSEIEVFDTTKILAEAAVRESKQQSI